jgi:hypothetical protein
MVEKAKCQTELCNPGRKNIPNFGSRREIILKFLLSGSVSFVIVNVNHVTKVIFFLNMTFFRVTKTFIVSLL